MDILDITQRIFTFFQDPNSFIKIALVLVLLLYLLFSFIFARQISHLIELVDQVTFSPVLKFIVYGISLATVALLILVILV